MVILLLRLNLIGKELLYGRWSFSNNLSGVLLIIVTDFLENVKFSKEIHTEAFSRNFMTFTRKTPDRLSQKNIYYKTIL
jgi:hypothetical protein